MPSGADLEYARMLAQAGVSPVNSQGYDGARLEQMGDVAGPDNITAEKIATPGTAMNTAVLETVAGALAPSRSILATMGVADAAKSLASSQAVYTDADELNEDWADTVGWQNDAGLPVSGGFLFGKGTAASSVVSGTLLDLSGYSRTKSILGHVNGGGARNTLFGFSNQVAGSARNNDLNDFTGVGVFNNGAGAAWLIAYDRGSIVGGSINSGPSITDNFSTSYVVTLITDEDWISATISTGDGKFEWGVRIDRNTYDPKQLAWWSSDSREITGDNLARVTSRSGIATHPYRSANEVSLPSAHRLVLNGQDVHIATPVNYDSRIPSPLVIYFHGYGGNQNSVLQNYASSNVFNTYGELLANGYIVASSLARGGDEVGTGFDDYATLYRYVRDNYAIGPVLILAESFGNVAAARLLSAKTVPNIAAWASFYGVLDLALTYAASRNGDNVLANAIDAKYGSLEDAQLAGADPMLIDTASYRAVPFRAWHSPDDTTVPKQCTDAFGAKLFEAGHYVEITTTTGNHGDPSNFVPGAVLGFFNAALGRI